MSVRSNWNFHVASTAIGTGNDYKIANVGANTTIAISISGTATARTVLFKAKGLVGDFVAINCYNSTTGNLATQTVGIIDEIWIVDVTGIDEFRCEISVISGGNLSISAKAVE